MPTSSALTICPTIGQTVALANRELCRGQSRLARDVSVSDARMGAATAALPPIADMASAAAQVRFVPISEVAPVFNRLVDRRDKRGQVRRFSPHPPQSPLFEKSGIPYGHRPREIDDISAFVTCCCFRWDT